MFIFNNTICCLICRRRAILRTAHTLCRQTIIIICNTDTEPYINLSCGLHLTHRATLDRIKLVSAKIYRYIFFFHPFATKTYYNRWKQTCVEKKRLYNNTLPCPLSVPDVNVDLRVTARTSRTRTATQQQFNII